MRSTLLFVSLCLAAGAQTPPPSDSSVIQALLSEVHQLRLAIERSKTLSPRIQLAVERLKLQQQTVARLSDQLDGVRRDIERMQSDQARAADHVKTVESELNQTTDPNKRTAMEGDLNSFKPEIERMQKAMDAQRAREADLGSRLRSEQATLDGLNDHLNQIERSLSQ